MLLKVKITTKRSSCCVKRQTLTINTPRIFPQLRDVLHRFLEPSGKELKTESYVPMAVGELVNAGQARVKVLSSSDPWFGVTYQDDKPRVVDSIRALVNKGVYPEALWK